MKRLPLPILEDAKAEDVETDRKTEPVIGLSVAQLVVVPATMPQR